MELNFLLLSEPTSCAASAIRRFREIASASGLTGHFVNNLQQYQALCSSPEPSVVVIDGVHGSIAQVLWQVSLIRMRRRVGVIVITTDSSSARAQAYAAGADLCLTQRAESAEFLAAACALARRLSEPPGQETSFIRDYVTELDTPPNIATPTASLVALGDQAYAASRGSVAQSPSGSVWRLQGSGWTLVSPQGDKIDLPAAERGFLKQLFRAKGQIATYEQLVDMDGLHRKYDYTNCKARLACIVNRLKKKCRLVGVLLPIQSARGQGYHFAAKSVWQ